MKMALLTVLCLISYLSPQSPQAVKESGHDFLFEASPEQCSDVTYTEVATGVSKDAGGATPTRVKLAPKLYKFSCKCGSTDVESRPTMVGQVTSYRFHCDSPETKEKNQKTKSDSRPNKTPPIAQSAQGGINIGGDNNGNAQVNNYNFQRAPRTLLNQQLLINALLHAPPRKLTSLQVLYGSGSDASELQLKLWNVLKASGWVVPTNNQDTLLTSGVFPDVLMVLHGEPFAPGSTNNALNIGDDDPFLILAHALANSGLHVNIDRRMDIPEDAVQIIIH